MTMMIINMYMLVMLTFMYLMMVVVTTKKRRIRVYVQLDKLD